MNKKFFAALASATMAFSATGSLAVFAQDFEDEVAPVLPGTPAETPTKIMFTEENFGDLVDTTKVEFFDGANTPAPVTLTKDKDVTDSIKTVKTIKFKANFAGEIKGLEYFTGLTTFNAKDNDPVLTNTSLDFSANSSLTNISIASAPGLRNFQLPEALEDEDGDKSYSLATLELNDSKLLSIDLTEQTALASITMTGGMLQDIQLPSNAKTALTTLDLSNNMLDSLNLKGFKTLTAANLKLDGNHLGTIDFTLNGTQNQTVYVAAGSGSVNLLEMYPDFNFKYANETATPNGTFEEKNGNKTGVFKLNANGEGDYTYNGMTVNIKAANPMYRLYNPNSGEHFYTKDAAEQKALVALGWQDEGYGWVAPLKDDTNVKPVYRLYNPNAGDHHYTVSPVEKAALIAGGWKDENIGWYSADPTGAKPTVTVYRQYNPFAKGAGAHNYTMDLAENDYLVALGWVPENAAWTALK